MNQRFDPSLLSGYLDGELSPAEAALVEKVLAEHPEQQAELESLRGIRDALALWPAVEPTSDPVAAVRQRIDQQRAAALRQTGRLPRHWVALMAMAASLLMVLGLLAYRSETRQLTLAPADRASDARSAAAPIAPRAEERGVAILVDDEALSLPSDLQAPRDQHPAAPTPRNLRPRSAALGPSGSGGITSAGKGNGPARAVDAVPAQRTTPAASDAAALGVEVYDAPSIVADPQQRMKRAVTPLHAAPLRQQAQSLREAIEQSLPGAAPDANDANDANDAAMGDAATRDNKPSGSGADAFITPETKVASPQSFSRSPAETSAPDSAAALSPMDEMRSFDFARSQPEAASEQDMAAAANAGGAEAGRRTSGFYWYFAIGGPLPDRRGSLDADSGPDPPRSGEALPFSPADASSPAPRLLRGQIPLDRWAEAQHRLQQQLETHGLQNRARSSVVGGAWRPSAPAEALPKRLRVAVNAPPETVRALQAALEQQLRSLGGTLTVVSADGTPRSTGGGGMGGGGMGGGAASLDAAAPQGRSFADDGQDEMPPRPPPMVIELSAGE